LTKQQLKQKPSKPVAPKKYIPPPPPAPANAPVPFKREIFFPLVPNKAASVQSKAPPAAIEENVTKYLYPPYVAPFSIAQKGKVRAARKAPALSPIDFISHIHHNVNAAAVAASAPIPVSVPAPAGHAPKRVGRSHKHPVARPPRANIGGSEPSSPGGFAGIFSSIKKRFGFKESR
jgi:hypothetical protein